VRLGLLAPPVPFRAPSAQPDARALQRASFLTIVRDHSDAAAIHVFVRQAVDVRRAIAAAARRLALQIGDTRQFTFDDLFALPALIDAHPTAFWGDFEDLFPLATVRQAVGGHFPICTTISEIYQPDLLTQALGFVLYHRPFDCLVATNRSLAAATSALFDEMLDRVSGRLCSTARPSPTITVIPGAVDTERLRPTDRAAARACLGLPRSGTIVSTLDSLASDDIGQLESVFRAFDAVRDVTPDVRLLIGNAAVGVRTAIEELARDCGIVDRLAFLDEPLTASVKPLVCAASDLVLSWQRSLEHVDGRPVLEAMSCSVPVIASDWGANRDLVEHGETGFLVPTHWDAAAAAESAATISLTQKGTTERYLASRTLIDVDDLASSLRALVGDRDLRARMGAAARRRAVERHACPVVARAYDDLWNDQLSRASASRDTAPTFALRLDRVFEQFAPALASPTLVAATAATDVVWRRSPLATLPDELPPSVVERILDRCAEASHSVAELAQEAPEAADCIAYLMKKGYLTTPGLRTDLVG
jgi:glycosyltransferase involved in cell wall biosynthesis